MPRPMLAEPPRDTRGMVSIYLRVTPAAREALLQGSTELRMTASQFVDFLLTDPLALLKQLTSAHKALQRELPAKTRKAFAKKAVRRG